MVLLPLHKMAILATEYGCKMNGSEASEPVAFETFLQEQPPNSRPIKISQICVPNQYQQFDLVTPDLYLYCPDENCRGYRFFFFQGHSEPRMNDTDWHDCFLEYLCRNCLKQSKKYALEVRRIEGQAGEAVKLGERPSFGPPIPPRVISLVGPDRELFMGGFSSEIRGLGIGAFSYYRRIVNNQWKRFLAEVKRVAEKVGTARAVLDTLDAALKEDKFSKAVDIAKDAIPESLRINGHNPLTLLYKALSDGLHEQSDVRCLELAHDIRIVLTELAERIGQALKDEKQLADAISRLFERNQPKEKPSSTPPAEPTTGQSQKPT